MESKLKKDAEKPTQNDSNKIGSPDISGIFWMKRYLRNRLVLPIFALIGFIGLTGIFINSYASRYTKAVFEEYVLSNFGYDAIVNGEISIEFQNKFLVTLKDVRIKSPNTNQELLSAKSISAEIIPKTIFSAPLSIIEIALDRPHLNYSISNSEDLTWLFNKNDAASNSANLNFPFTEYNLPSPFKIVDGGELRIQKILVKDGSLDWKNIQKKSQRELRQINFTIEKVGESNQEVFIGGSLSIKTYINLLKNVAEWPFTFSTEIHENSEQSTVELRNMTLGITPLLFSGGITFSPRKYTGTLYSNKFEVTSLIETLQLAKQKNPIRIGVDEKNNWSVKSDFNGNKEEGFISKNVITIAEEFIEADIDWLFSDSQSTPTLRYEVRGGRVNLASLFQNTVSIIKTTPTVDLSAFAFQNFNNVGKVTLESFVLPGFEAENLNFSANLERGVFDLELTPLDVFGGTLSGFLRLDSNLTPPNVQTSIKGRRVNVARLAPAMSTRYGLAGDLSFEATVNATAQDQFFTQRSIVNSVGGNITFALADSTTNISLLSQTFSSIAALNPIAGGFELWADEQKFGQVGGFVILENGLSDTHRLNLRLDNADIDAVGKLDFETKSFDYEVEATLLPEPEKQTLPIGDSYKNLGWPIVCQSRWQIETDQYCRPDFTKVRNIFADFSSGNILEDKQIESAEEERMRALLETLFD